MPARNIEGSSPKIILELPSARASAEVSLYGATVTSWKIDGRELLMVSKNAILDGSKAIRGGIPIVFPQFGVAQAPSPMAALPQHGIARISTWEYLGILTDNEKEISVRFGLKDTQIAKHRNLWPNSFRLHYTVTLSSDGSFSQRLNVKNEGSDTFEFNTLLHTYFEVSDISKVKVRGLKNFSFFDKVHAQRGIEKSDSITIAEEVDRVYEKVDNNTIEIDCGDHLMRIEKNNFKDVVVWNPWVDKSKQMADFGDEEYKHMICVEVGNVAAYHKLREGESWEGRQTLRLI
ncbi:uncharacterized protein VTP21DRAFT_1011 [Calcarisporiella thermophila]|uniref:uncharacterized protein n=1 Tax=Calcarisporiella thermophila TaxID=911321 RepID=UPI003743F2CF